MSTPTILGIDPGTKEMGIAVIRGPELLAYGVYTLKNGARPHDVIGQARAKVLAAIEAHAPRVVALEQPFFRPGRRIALLNVIAEELRQRSAELGIRVVELSPQEVRERLIGNPKATKLDVATALVERFPELREKLPEKPRRSALELKPREKYWLHMFDALGVAVVCTPPQGGGLRSRQEPQTPGTDSIRRETPMEGRVAMV